MTLLIRYEMASAVVGGYGEDKDHVYQLQGCVESGVTLYAVDYKID